MEYVSEAPEDVATVIKAMGIWQNKFRVCWFSDAEVCSSARKRLLEVVQANDIFALSIVPSQPRVQQIIWLKRVICDRSAPVVIGEGEVDPTFMRPFQGYFPPKNHPKPNPRFDIMRAIQITEETIGRQPKHLQELLRAFLQGDSARKIAVTFADFSTGNLAQRVFTRE